MQTEKHNLQQLFYLITIYTTLVVISVFIHNKLIDTPKLKQRMELHRAVLEGRAAAPIQYRIMTYYLSETMQRCGISFKNSYLIIRFVFTLLSILLFHIYLTRWFDIKTVVIGCLFLIGAFPFTYHNYFMQPMDPVNLFFFLIGLMIIRDRKDFLLLPLLIISMLNRETPAFLVLVYAFYRYDELHIVRFILRFLMLCATAICMYAGLRLIIGEREYYSQFFWAQRNLTEPFAYTVVILILSIFLFLAWKDLKYKPKFLVRSAMMVPFFFMVHWGVTVAWEPRLYLPIIPIMIPLGLLSLFDSKFGSIGTVSLPPKYFDSIKYETQGKLNQLIIKHNMIIYTGVFLSFTALFSIFCYENNLIHFRQRRAIEHINKASYYQKEGLYKHAVIELNKALENDSHNAMAHMSLGIMYTYYLPASKGAIYHWKKALENGIQEEYVDRIKKEIEKLTKE